MKNLFNSLLIVMVLLISSCNTVFNKRVKGNGIVTTEQRSVSTTKKIKIAGNINVELTQGGSSSLTINADANLIPYIITVVEDGWLVIKSKKDVNLSSSNPITVAVEANLIEQIKIAGNGNVVATNKIEGGEKLNIVVAGNGDVNLAINAPSVESTISGNGNIVLEGETKNVKVTIAGNGDYKGEKLKAEQVKVSIAGTGNVDVFAAKNLDINIAGSGDVRYIGNPTISKKIAGSGSINPF